MALTLNPQTYKAIKTVNTAVESWQKSLEEFSEFLGKYTEERIMELSEQEAALVEKIANLKAEYSEKMRIFKVDHDLAIKASKEEALQDLAVDLDQIILTRAEHDVLVTKANAQANETAAEVAKAKAIVERNYKATIKEMELVARAENAEVTAQVSNLNQTIHNKDQEIARLNALLEAANATIVKVAESNSATVNVESKR